MINLVIFKNRQVFLLCMDSPYSDQQFSHQKIFQPALFPRGGVLGPVLGSLLYHAAFYGALGLSLTGNSLGIEENQEKQSEEQHQRSIEEILKETPCTKNPFHNQIAPKEREFVEGLVADLQDEKLDSMSFGHFMVQSEVYVHNSEQYCVEQQWNMRERLQGYDTAEKELLAPLMHKEYSPSVLLGDLFSELHNPQYGQKNAFLREEDDYQARLLIAQDTGKFNCKSGTMWFTAVGSAHPDVANKLQTMVYDNHILSVFQQGKKQYFFEHRDPYGVFVQSEKQGVIREKEMFVIEYLLARDVSLEQLHEKFQKWYETKAVAGLINPKSNTFGIEAKVGIRSKTIDEELQEVPFRYPAPNCKSGICVVEFDAEKYNWYEILKLLHETGAVFEVDINNEYPPLHLNSYHYAVLEGEKFALLQLGDYRIGSQVYSWSEDYKRAQEVQDYFLSLLYEEIQNPKETPNCEVMQDNFTLYSTYASLSVSQLSELFYGRYADDSLLECRRYAVVDYVTGHYKEIQKAIQIEAEQKGYPSFSMQAAFNFAWEGFEYCNTHSDCTLNYVPLIFRFAFQEADPGFFEKDIYPSLEQSPPKFWNLTYINMNIGFFYQSGPEIWEPTKAYLRKAYRQEREYGLPAEKTAVARFCDRYPRERPKYQQITGDLYYEFCFDEYSHLTHPQEHVVNIAINLEVIVQYHPQSWQTARKILIEQLDNELKLQYPSKLPIELPITEEVCKTQQWSTSPAMQQFIGNLLYYCCMTGYIFPDAPNFPGPGGCTDLQKPQ